MGTPQELTDECGNVVWCNYEFAWGGRYTHHYATQSLNGCAIIESDLQPIRFQGQFYDVETGLHYNRFRYYDSDVGMFIQRDPIGLLGGWNVFAYAPNPIGWVDPWGLAKKKTTNKTPAKDCCEEDPCADGKPVQWSKHGNKHVPPPISKKLTWKEIVKNTANGKPAKYKNDINIAVLEKQAWNKGIKVAPISGKNATYKVFEVNYILGASNGQETKLMRVECSQGIIHGHPITLENYQKLLGR